MAARSSQSVLHLMVSTVQAVVESWHTWMIDNAHKIIIKCMFETIDRTRSGTSNKFWQGIKQLNGMPPETIIGRCARSTNVYMRDKTISSSTLSMGTYNGVCKICYQILYYFPDIHYTVAFSSSLQRV